jgi:hypothetical protein
LSRRLEDQDVEQDEILQEDGKKREYQEQLDRLHLPCLTSPTIGIDQSLLPSQPFNILHFLPDRRQSTNSSPQASRVDVTVAKSETRVFNQNFFSS